jgi:hypothetical protein
MSVRLLDSEPILASHWNALFSDLDSKLTKVMHAKNLVLLGDQVRPLLGMLFCFGNGFRPQSQFIAERVYDHSIFQDAIAAAEYELFDEDAKIVVTKNGIDDSFRTALGLSNTDLVLDYSLEAHRIPYTLAPNPSALFWVLESGAVVANTRPQKLWKYAQAEIIVEGIGMQRVVFEPAWNKFNFFRVHNCNAYDIQVEFPGFTLSVPRWGSRCLRRTPAAEAVTDASLTEESIDTTTLTADRDRYTEGFNYFHRFLPGDPTLFKLPTTHQSPTVASMGANNVTSPAIAYAYIDLFTQTEGAGALRPGPRWKLDPHALYDVSALYAPAHYPEITPATIIGDLLHHRGALKLVKTDAAAVVTETDVTFQGYADLAARLAALGITVAENGENTLTLYAPDATATYDLWGIGTNLLQHNATPKPAANLNTAYALDTHAPDSTVVRPVLSRTTTETYYWRPLGDTAPDATVELLDQKRVSQQEDALSYSANILQNVPNRIRIHRNTAADILSLNAWGDPNYGGQDTNRATFQNRCLTLTPFGLTLTFNQVIPLDYRPEPPYGSLLANYLVDATTAHVTLTGKNLTYQHALTFTGYGWPTFAEPAFISPRKNRVVASIPTKAVETWDGLAKATEPEPFPYHPNIAHQPFGSDGEDFEPIPRSAAQLASESTEIAILTPLTLTNISYNGLFSAFDFSVYANTDVLSEFLEIDLSEYASQRAAFLANQTSESRMIRMNGLREHFNALASTVNALTHCRPFTFANFRIPFGESTTTFPPNTTGPFAGKYRPANQYASFERDSDQWKLCQQLGITIKSAAEFPEGYSSLKTLKRKTASIATKFRRVLTLKRTRRQVQDPNEFPPSYFYFFYFDSVTTIGESRVQIEEYEFDRFEDFVEGIFEGSGTDDSGFYWCTIEDVQAAAENLGFLFHYEHVSVPYRLMIFEITQEIERDFVVPESGELRSQTPEPGDGPWYYPSPEQSSGALKPGTLEFEDFSQNLPLGDGFVTRPAMIECVSGETAEWVREPEGGSLPAIGITSFPVTSLRVRDYRAGDVIASRHQGITEFDFFIFLKIRSLEAEAEDQPDETTDTQDQSDDGFRYLRQNEAFIRRYVTANIAAGQASIIPYGVSEHASFLFQCYASAGLTRASKAVLIPAPFVKHSTEEFSRESRRNALGKIAYGTVVIPIESSRPVIVSEHPLI